MNIINQSQQGDDFIQNTTNDELFYIKNKNIYDYIIPTNLIKNQNIELKKFSCLFCLNISVKPLN